jgi:hypothetical protein
LNKKLSSNLICEENMSKKTFLISDFVPEILVRLKGNLKTKLQNRR